MSGPKVTATISAHDAASATIREFAALAKRVGVDLQKALDVDGSRYVNSIRRANDATRRHVSQVHQVRDAWRGVGAAITAVGSAAAIRAATAAIGRYVPLERENRFIKAAGEYSPDDMNRLLAQQKVAAQVYGEKNEATADAQKVFAVRGIAAPINEALTQWALVTAKALGVSAKESAAIIEGAIFAKGKSPHSVAEAQATGKFEADLATVMSKKGGMSAEDIAQYYKFSAAIAHAAGIGENTLSAIGMTLKRANIGGDEAGTFTRQLASRLMAPTQAGRQAMIAAGIDYDSYAKNGTVSSDTINRVLKERYGKSLSDDQRKSIDRMWDDKSVNTKGDFVEKVVSALSGELGLKAQDRNRLSKDLGRQWDLARQGLNSEKLIADIFKKMTPQQLLEFVGVKQGSRGAVVLGELEKYQENLAAIDKGLEGEGRATEIARERMEGLAASTDRFKSTIDDASNSLVRANQNVLVPIINGTNKAVAWLDSFSDTSKVAATAAAGVTLLGAVGASGMALWRFVSSLTVAAAAIRGVAAGTAVTTAATTAATAGGAAAAGRTGVAAAIRTGVFTMGAAALPFLPYAIAAVGVGAGLYALHQAYGGENAGKTLNERLTKNRGGSLTDAYRKSFNAERERLGLPQIEFPKPHAESRNVPAPAAAVQQPQPVQVSGEAEVVMNSRIDVGLKPEVLDIINKARIGLNSDHRLGSSVPQGIGKASADVPLPIP